jgi:hypothetical protein
MSDILGRIHFISSGSAGHYQSFSYTSLVFAAYFFSGNIGFMGLGKGGLGGGAARLVEDV